MMNKLKISIELTEIEELSKTLNENLKRFNESKIGNYQPSPFLIYKTDDEGVMIGGVKGDFLGELCRVFTVWVHEDCRQKGLGTELFEKLESLAKIRKCKIIQLDTAEFQAKEFYEKLGYSVVAILPNNFMGYTSYIMRKTLI